MAEGTQFDVVLFGYRNDVARARTLDVLSRFPASPAGPAALDRDTSVPQRLFTRLDLQAAQRLCAQLEQLGAQVALLPVGPPEGAPAAVGGPEVSRAAPVAKQVRRVRPLTLALAVLLAAATYLWRETALVQRRPPPPRAPATRLEPMDNPERIDEPAAAKLNAAALDLVRAGQFREAVQQLQMALRLAPDHPVLMKNLQTVLLNWAVTDLAADKLDDAGDRLQQAAGLGDRVEVLRALGVTYVRQGDYAQAAVTLEHALQLAPTDSSTMLALAEVYLRQDKRPEAFDLLRRVKESGAGGPDLDKKLEQLSREVDAEWDFTQLQSRHFRVRFGDDQDTRSVRLMLDTLEDAYDAVGAKLGAYPEERTPVVLYTQQDFHAITRTPDWAGAAFDGRIKIPVRGLAEDDPNLPRIVRHEYAHSVVAQLTSGHCPVWLSEGLAVWAEEDGDGDREPWAQEKIADQPLFTLGELNASFTRLPPDRVEVAYAQSYLAVRSLVDRYGVRKIPALLGALSRARNLDEAFAATYPGDLAGFQQQLLHQLGG